MKLHQRNLSTSARQNLPELGPGLGPGPGPGAGTGPGKYEKRINKNFMKVHIRTRSMRLRPPTSNHQPTTTDPWALHA